MLEQDLEETTSRQLRTLLEKEMDMDLNKYREFLDREMLQILGQMERPSKIWDYLYLVSANYVPVDNIIMCTVIASIPGRLKDGLVHTVCACVNRPKNLGGRDILVF